MMKIFLLLVLLILGGSRLAGKDEYEVVLATKDKLSAEITLRPHIPEFNKNYKIVGK